MDAIRKIEAALAAGPTDGDWELCYLNMPLEGIGAYVQKCVVASGGDKYHFISAVRADGAPVDVAHYGNGPTSNVNGHWATVTRPDAIREVLQTLASKEAELVRLRAALAPFARFSCSPPGECQCNNCIARDLLATPQPPKEPK